MYVGAETCCGYIVMSVYMHTIQEYHCIHEQTEYSSGDYVYNILKMEYEPRLPIYNVSDSFNCFIIHYL